MGYFVIIHCWCWYWCLTDQVCSAVHHGTFGRPRVLERLYIILELTMNSLSIVCGARKGMLSQVSAFRRCSDCTIGKHYPRISLFLPALSNSHRFSITYNSSLTMQSIIYSYSCLSFLLSQSSRVLSLRYQWARVLFSAMISHGG